MYRLVFFALVSIVSSLGYAHHWVHEVYDGEKRFIADVEVKKFSLINPHPLMSIEIKNIHGDNTVDGAEVGQTWVLEMDNRRELTDLGFNPDTFIPGDQITVAVDPSFDTSYRKNTMYIRAIEHSRQGFIYIHNVRELFPVDSDGNGLVLHLQKAR